jgi:hypothetical protein
MLNLAALAFTVAFSGFLLLGVNWQALLTAECIEKVGTGVGGSLSLLYKVAGPPNEKVHRKSGPQ